MTKKYKYAAIVDALVHARSEPPNPSEQYIALRAENQRLFHELKEQYLENAWLKNERSPKKRGPKPKLKTEINHEPKKLGRPPKYSEEMKKMLIDYLDISKRKNGFDTDTDALRHFLEEICVEKGNFKSKHSAREILRSLLVLASKTRKKIKEEKSNI